MNLMTNTEKYKGAHIIHETPLPLKEKKEDAYLHTRNEGLVTET